MSDRASTHRLQVFESVILVCHSLKDGNAWLLSVAQIKPNKIQFLNKPKVKMVPLPGTGWSPRPGSPVLGSAGGSGRWAHPCQHTGSYSGSDPSQTLSYTAVAAHLKWSLGRAWRRNKTRSSINVSKWVFKLRNVKIFPQRWGFCCYSNARTQI